MSAHSRSGKADLPDVRGRDSRFGRHGGDTAKVMSRLRIALADSKLAEIVEEADDVARRRALNAGAHLAVDRTLLVDERITAAWRAIAAGRVGDCPERRQVEELASELDEAAWRCQEEVEKGQAQQDEYLAAFSKARAAASVAYVFEPDARVAAGEGLYEAYHAVRDQAALQAVVEAALRTYPDWA